MQDCYEFQADTCDETQIDSVDSQEFAQLSRSIEGPSWRNKLAERLAASRPSAWHEIDDDLVQQTTRFYQLLTRNGGDGQQPHQDFPQIAAARKLWQQSAQREQLMVLVLGDCPRAEIVERCNLELKTLETIEGLYFDIRDSRRAAGWINAHVILPTSRSGDCDLAVKLRQAYWGGPLVATTLLDTGCIQRSSELEHIADQEQLLQLKLSTALEIPVTDQRQATQLVKILSEYDLKSKRLELDKQRFRHRCEQDMLQHELALLRQQSPGRATDVERQRHDHWYAEYAAQRQRSLESPLAKLHWGVPQKSEKRLVPLPISEANRGDTIHKTDTDQCDESADQAA